MVHTGSAAISALRRRTGPSPPDVLQPSDGKIGFSESTDDFDETDSFAALAPRSAGGDGLSEGFIGRGSDHNFMRGREFP